VVISRLAQILRKNGLFCLKDQDLKQKTSIFLRISTPPAYLVEYVSFSQRLLASDSDNDDRQTRGQQMSEYPKDTDAATRCEFCGKHLPIVNGELQPWRAPNGQFYCNEFCADDAEEVRFRRHGRAERKAHERDFFF
jgi:hypothetical protein